MECENRPAVNLIKSRVTHLLRWKHFSCRNRCKRFRNLRWRIFLWTSSYVAMNLTAIAAWQLKAWARSLSDKRRKANQRQCAIQSEFDISCYLHKSLCVWRWHKLLSSYCLKHEKMGYTEYTEYVRNSELLASEAPVNGEQSMPMT